MPTLNGITYEELAGSGRMAYTHEAGWHASREFIVDWGDRRAFCEALLGYSEDIGGMGVRIPGQQYPGYAFLFCRDVQVEGIGELQQGPDMAAYTHAKIDATYRPNRLGTSTGEEAEFDEDEEARLARLDEQWDFGGEYFSVPGSSYWWVAGNQLVEESVGIMIGTIDIVLTSEQEPVLNRSRVAQALGCVNASPWYGFPGGRVLFLGASARRTITAAGIGAWQITYRFRGRSIPWNHFMRPGLGWQAIYDPDTGQGPYSSYEFYNLFV